MKTKKKYFLWRKRDKESKKYQVVEKDSIIDRAIMKSFPGDILWDEGLNLQRYPVIGKRNSM